MSALKPRNRVIVFRVTDDEYDTLKGACQSAGGRNLSEFTRSELLDRLATDPVTARFGALEQRLSELQTQMQNLVTAVTSGAGSTQREPV